MRIEVELRDDGIHFSRYPYPGAAVFPSGLVRHAEIREVDPRCTPPEIRLASGEVLFVPATRCDELERVVAARSLAVVQRVDVWGLILEPFLDTEFDVAHQERTLDRLEENGISRAEVAELRRRFATPMLRYNAIHWEWAHLGLSDLLDAHLGRLPTPAPFVHRDFERLYREAMAIAERGHRTPSR